LKIEYSPDPYELLEKFWNIAKEVHGLIMKRYKEYEKVNEEIKIIKQG
jgi:hypothetical protein